MSEQIKDLQKVEYIKYKCPYGINSYGAIKMTTELLPEWKNCCRTKGGEESATCGAHKNEQACINGGCKWGTERGKGCYCGEDAMERYAGYLNLNYPHYGIEVPKT